MGVSVHFGQAVKKTGKELRSSGKTELSARYASLAGMWKRKLEAEAVFFLWKWKRENSTASTST